MKEEYSELIDKLLVCSTEDLPKLSDEEKAIIYICAQINVENKKMFPATALVSAYYTSLEALAEKILARGEQ